MADATSTDTTERRTIFNNTQAWVGSDRVGVSNAATVRRDGGSMVRRAQLHVGTDRVEVLEGDEVEVDGRTWRVSLDLDRPGVVLVAA